MGGDTPLGRVIWEGKDLREHIETWENILGPGDSKSSECIIQWKHAWSVQGTAKGLYVSSIQTASISSVQREKTLEV